MRNYSDKDLEDVANNLLHFPENEVVEFKKARNNYDFNKIGKYVSALSNEANLRGTEEAWMLFGVSDNGEVVGSNFGASGPQPFVSLQKAIASHTNNRFTFHAARPLTIKGRRVVIFQIPPATLGNPTTWNGAAYSRIGDALEPLPLHEIDIIRGQTGRDWSKRIIPEAGMKDLDKKAIQKAREIFAGRWGGSTPSRAELARLSDEEFLDKAGLTIHGNITHTALLLLGKSDASYLLDGFTPRLTWTLYGALEEVKSYEHFSTPFLLTIDQLFSRIRNPLYYRSSGKDTLLQDSVPMYEPEVIRELLCNCVAHQDYQLRGRVDVQEFEDCLMFSNPGSFLPGSIDHALARGYKAPYYRNPFLFEAMTKLGLIDTNSMGIRAVFQRQKERLFPLPSYDVETMTQVRVELYGRPWDDDYTEILRAHADLDLRTVRLLDQVQKKQIISETDARMLAQQGFIEGDFPNIYLNASTSVAADDDDNKNLIVVDPSSYSQTSGSSARTFEEELMHFLQSVPEATIREILVAIGDLLPIDMEESQRIRKISNTMQKLKRAGKVKNYGTRRYARWRLCANAPDRAHTRI